MKPNRVILVHLRQPVRSDLGERRADPFYEFGSFGCTKCHSRNLMNPRRAHELEGVRLAFSQGGSLGFRLVHCTPPVRVRQHSDRCELLWTPTIRPFRYDRAPLLVNHDGESDFPALRRSLENVLRDTWPARFSSAFRSCRTPVSDAIASEIVRLFDRRRQKANPDTLADSYVDALPYPPNSPDLHRQSSLKALRAQAGHRPACLRTRTPADLPVKI